MTNGVFILYHAYSRKQAIEDGVLVDATEAAKELGLIYPVALTCKAWAECVYVPEGPERHESELVRLWDLVGLLGFVSMFNGGSPEFCFSLDVQNPTEWGDEPKLVRLRAVCGIDDDASPWVTVMLEDEG